MLLLLDRLVLLMSNIKFLDLYKQYESIKDEIDFAIEKTILNSSFIRGEEINKFEREFASLIGSKNCISCGNGTDAIYIALKSLGISPGDEIIVPAHSWISTSETVTQAGGKVVFCDTDVDTFTIDPEEIQNKITKNTVGIIPVHLYGHAANMYEILEIAKKHKLWIIEDCAQAHLTKFDEKIVGNFGVASTFSFYPGKNLGAMGDAGAIITNDQSLATKMQMFSRHGGLIKGQHDIEGINSRMDGIQAAVLRVKMRYLEKWINSKREKAKIYNENLSCIDNITIPKVLDNVYHSWHLYVIKTEFRDQLAEYLKNQGISTQLNYPIALPFLKAYSYLNHLHSDFPNAFYNQSRILSLPIYPELSNDDIIYICEKVKEFFKFK